MGSKTVKSNSKVKNTFGYKGDFSSTYSDDLIDMDDAAERAFGEGFVKTPRKKKSSY